MKSYLGEAAMNRMGQRAVARYNYNQNPEPDVKLETGGLLGQRTTSGINTQPVAAPGVGGVTPGAVERRLGSVAPSIQGGGMPQPPSQAAVANFGNPRQVQHAPNLQGPGRKQMNAPVGNLQNFLQNLQQRNSQER